MDLATSKTYATARDLEQWNLESDAVLQVKLLLASDYIAERYQLKSILSGVEQAKYDTAHFKIAYDFLINGDPATREARTAIKESSELEGVGKTSKEYGDVVYDPYPGITRLLEPLLVSGGSSSASFGKLVR